MVGEKLSVPRNSVCGGGTITSLASMRSGEASRKNTTRLFENPNLFARALSEKLTGPWIEHAFEKRECIKFVGQPGTPESHRIRWASPDCDYHYYLSLQDFLVGRDTRTQAVLDNHVEQLINTRPKQFWKDGSRKLAERWQQGPCP
ncbi:unnamed protein product [Heligmosomoides polygyrus]|uniref:Uncharacterized protein n=1 Tax=Heligmosomoides polygyrus TaxID=6339 RepID=A0A3P8CFF4_HELPZ|nr:unnamed protein product [Heligmosomoides polygyrus]